MGIYKYIYGPVPSRRMGISLGISPIPKKYCNYSCIYCQLGRTKNLTNRRSEFFDLKEIVKEFEDISQKDIYYDVVTIVGEGEPTLYSELGKLIKKVKSMTDKPVAVITNGALMYDEKTRKDLMKADIVLPSIDACNENMFTRINRPSRSINYKNMVEGLIEFSKHYSGQLWLEIMLVKGYNDSVDNLIDFKKILSKINYDKLYINTPVRPPAESFVKKVDPEKMELAVEMLEGISIDQLISEGFYSEIEDDVEAVVSIIKRHPMNQFEIVAFLEKRGNKNPMEVFEKLSYIDEIEVVEYMNYDTYRLI
ncbi:Wyosine [tRNA(Phe)-imidazoG37] synthetase, radical SAM superfamily [Dethiosulfatibacter aminovorans DSM 17477]|uniref:Wyosine [tRNA(Phe)-imidazoG37] synthetase, radical SAM superfamily n=1 Tax=Dethiosulfatibacter aminovorans DSM 17477 TaxID=1121476 RepID=A0A1M6KV59_9FIRM|nr:radical SAM protein [Dethiosulfatibacter aminovorans]SHJ62847.1 Wyosine [tRNA(Phe)-imidazoG37] synthetase, radical SAM superfamily [Dethiosulfatibacter aminovorans DSM 17477]